MNTTFYLVEIRNTHEQWENSRIFEKLTAARRWCKWCLVRHPEVRIVRQNREERIEVR